MATIINNPKYPDGHLLELTQTKSALSESARKKFAEYGYKPGEEFTLLKSNPPKIPDVTILLAEGKWNVWLKDKKKRAVFIKAASKSAIESIFVHGGGTASTAQLTELKEIISLHQIEAIVEKGKLLTEDEVFAKLSPTDKKNYRTLYYNSAVKQAEAFKKWWKSGKKGYEYERQQDKWTKPIYAQARKLSGLANDNWNPGDVWMKKRGWDTKHITKAKDIDGLNIEIARAFQKKDMISISLKQVPDNRTAGKVGIIDPNQLENMKVDLDFSFLRANDTFSNFGVETRSGYFARVGFKSGGTENVSMEGRMKGAGSALGAIDAGKYPKMVKDKWGYTLRNGKTTQVSTRNEQLMRKEIKEIYKRYTPKQVSNSIESADQMIAAYLAGDEFFKRRMLNIVSFLYSYLVLPKNAKEFQEHMKETWFLAKKLNKESSIYLLLN